MASSTDLVSLGDLKSWLDITSTDDDALLGRLISEITWAILGHIGRFAILPAAYVETYDGDGGVSIFLRNWPVIAISSCVIDGIAIPPAPAFAAGATTPMGYVLDAADPQPPGRMQRLSLRQNRFRRGLQNVTIAYTAGYRITGEAASVSGGGPYTTTAQAPFGDWAIDGGVTYANGIPLTAVAVNPALGQYAVADGVYTFASADAGAPVLLTYGYIPAGLAQCCMDWAAERYAYRSHIGQGSKSLGGQETTSFIVKDTPDFVLSALQPYRRVVTP